MIKEVRPIISVYPQIQYQVESQFLVDAIICLVLNMKPPFGGTHSHNEDAPCAVCSAASETTFLMIPGRDSCYPGWTKQYNGYLGTNRFDNVGATEYVCVDKFPEYLNGGERATDGALFHPVTYQCGALQCPPYTGNEVVSCVVCTK